MKKHSILRRVMATGVSALMIGVATAQSPPAYPHAVGEPHPELSAIDHANQPFQLSAQSGKVVVLHFCALWCAPCLQSAAIEGALIADLNAQIGEENWMFIDALTERANFTLTNTADALTWQSVGGSPARTLHAGGDPHSDLALLREQLTSYPTYVVIDTEGRVAAIFTGFEPGITGGKITSAVLKAWTFRPGQENLPFSLSPGMPRLSAGTVVADTALDPGGGGVATSERYTLKTGYVGQLYDVESLFLPPDPSAVIENPEAGSLDPIARPLVAQARMDDETLLDLNLSSVLWSIVSGPIASITSNNKAITLPVPANTQAIVRADALGLNAELTFTVLDVFRDNFGIVAFDGIEDSWQFQFFDANDNGELDETEAGNAAPTANPDNDSSDNFIEWAGGFDPSDPLDFLKFEVIGKQGDEAALRISKVRAGTVYSVQKSTDLDFDSSPEPIFLGSIHFEEENDSFTPETDSTDFILEDNFATEPRAFYRLLLDRSAF